MKKRILSLALVVVMVALVAAGSMAYFTDTDKVANTMTIGDVTIRIDEWTYDAATKSWTPFEESDFIMYPKTKADGMDDYNKMVYTWNVSKSKAPAYIVSWILCETPYADDEKVDQVAFSFSNTVERKYLIEKVQIGETYYDAYGYVAVDGQPIAYNKCLSSLSCVRLTEDTTQEQAALYGDELDIITFSQAIQAEGFNSQADALKALNIPTDAAEFAKLVANAQ